ncbi:MAG: 50S ribosomal protein L29 [Phycisphaerae bacterium]|jgi:large subunit ribosomal protein L29|nr:50S ribosomal protein L29 [Phycisphaerae bacterium]
MKLSEIRDLRTDERLGKLQELERKVFEIRSQAVTENLQNRHAIRNLRRDIARIKTIMREEERKVR